MNTEYTIKYKKNLECPLPPKEYLLDWVKFYDGYIIGSHVGQIKRFNIPKIVEIKPIQSLVSFLES